MSAERFLPFWRALDARFERVDPAWWGAVVTDSRFPAVYDANYARVETADPTLSAAEVEGALRPALGASGARHLHVVVHCPEDQTALLAELSSRGDRLAWDVVMEHRGDPPVPSTDVPAEVVEAPDRSFWQRFRESLVEFGVTDASAREQLAAMERDILLPAKRWLVARRDGTIASLAALVALEGAGYLDHVVTFPEYRGRGLAGALVAHAVGLARSEGLDPVFLLAEEGSRAVTLYRRLGFRVVARIGSTLAPLP